MQYTQDFSCNLDSEQCPYYTKKRAQTLFEAIKNFSLTEMAEFITQLCRERDEAVLEHITAQGYDAFLVSISFEEQVEENKKLLLMTPSDCDFDK
jgi:hypothetical protein